MKNNSKPNFQINLVNINLKILFIRKVFFLFVFILSAVGLTNFSYSEEDCSTFVIGCNETNAPSNSESCAAIWGPNRFPSPPNECTSPKLYTKFESNMITYINKEATKIGNDFCVNNNMRFKSASGLPFYMDFSADLSLVTTNATTQFTYCQLVATAGFLINVECCSDRLNCKQSAATEY
jgi:hypothetical protein